MQSNVICYKMLQARLQRSRLWKTARRERGESAQVCSGHLWLEHVVDELATSPHSEPLKVQTTCGIEMSPNPGFQLLGGFCPMLW